MANAPSFCGACGAALRGAGQFCTSCGQPVRTVGAHSATPDTTGAPPVGPEPPTVMARADRMPERAVPAAEDATLRFQSVEQPTEVLPPHLIPGAATPHTTVAVAPMYASILRRVGAVVVDGLVGLGIFIVAGTLVANGTEDTTANGFNLEGRPALIVIGISVLASLVYFIVMEMALGATLGKLVVDIRVRSASGTPPSPVAAIVRNLLRVVDGIGGYLVGGIVALVSKRRQRLGDMAAGTVVVPWSGGAGGRWVGLIGALAVLAAGVGSCITLRDPATDAVPAAAVLTPGTRSPTVAGPAPTVATSPHPSPRATPTASPTASAAAGARAAPTPAATPTRTPTGAAPVTSPITVTLARGVTSSYEPREPTTTFTPTTTRIYAAFTANGAGANARLRTVWSVVDVDAAAPAGTVLDEASVTLPRGTESGAFNLAQTGRPWPVGDYKVDVYLNDRLVLNVPYKVE